MEVVDETQIQADDSPLRAVFNFSPEREYSQMEFKTGEPTMGVRSAGTKSPDSVKVVKTP